jgi:pimeloyl-ACP methyl ester carboxylesterase
MRFVLVHGAWHGAWAWEEVIPELRSLGHEAVAIDLPCHGERRNETPSLEAWRSAVIDVLRPGDVLVAHSLGGFVASMAADQVPDLIEHLVFVAGGVPEEGKTLSEIYAAGLAPVEGPPPVDVVDGHLVVTSLSAAIETLFGDCDPETARRAYERFAGIPIPGPHTEPFHLEQFWTMDHLPMTYVRCVDDGIHPLALAEDFYGRLPEPKRWIDFPSAHSPFYSKPRELAELMVEVVK